MKTSTWQTTLDGVFVAPMPPVRTTDGHIVEWDRARIVRQIVQETKLVQIFYGYEGAGEDLAQEIATAVERRILTLGLSSLSGPLIREIVNITLLERGMIQYRNVCTRVGTPVYDAHLIDVGRGFEAKDNANLQDNAETSHKKKADKISKEQYLLQLPPHLADHHLFGDLHIHDLEYFGTRPFCLDGSTTVTCRELGAVRVIRLDGLSFDSDTLQPDDLAVLGPRGYRRVLKGTRRRVGANEVLLVQTSGDKTLLATKDHRIPVKGRGILRTEEIALGDELYSQPVTVPDPDCSKSETVVALSPATPSGPYVYDLFLEGSDEWDHMFYAAGGLVVHNCQDWDLRYFFYYGLMPDGNGTRASVAGPAMRPEVAVLHAVKALGSAQTNFAGGQGYYNFLTFMAPFFEGVSYDVIRQLMQMFVYEMTQMMVARGGQLVFSSVQLSPGVPLLWKDKPVVYKGRVWDGIMAPLRTYQEFEREVRLLFKALMEVMMEGDYWGKPFSFPKPEISIEPDFMHEDDEFNRANPDLPTYRDLYLMTFSLASKFGTPYYDNQMPGYRGAGKGISCYQCCAYQFSSLADEDAGFDEKLLFKDGMHFSMGSWQVVSVNCPRAAYRAEGSDERLFAELCLLMDIAIEVFIIKRRWMELIQAHFRMPFAQQRPRDPVTGERGAAAVDIKGLVYTIGVVGVNEMVQHHTGAQLHESNKAFKLAVRAMSEMERHAKDLSARYGMEIALARTPAETTGQRFAVSDLLNRGFRDSAMRLIKGDLSRALEMIGSTRDLPIYYTNGTHVAPGARISLAKRIEIEHVFFPIVDGGNIFHIWLGEARPDPRGLMDMAFKLCRSTQVGYFAFTRDLTVSLHQFKEYNPRRQGITGWMAGEAMADPGEA
ncbi:MAG: anaerobic ribonucleoside-triphosphate reductase [Methanomicrobiales archaeon]|nr:anaerobic ribonucleoside-triphosphate reductase [Methanomicrobiales archaeon]